MTHDLFDKPKPKPTTRELKQLVHLTEIEMGFLVLKISEATNRLEVIQYRLERLRVELAETQANNEAAAIASRIQDLKE